MDRIADSGSADGGSNPSGHTEKLKSYFNILRVAFSIFGVHRLCLSFLLCGCLIENV